MNLSCFSPCHHSRYKKRFEISKLAPKDWVAFPKTNLLIGQKEMLADCVLFAISFLTIRCYWILHTGPFTVCVQINKMVCQMEHFQNFRFQSLSLSNHASLVNDGVKGCLFVFLSDCCVRSSDVWVAAELVRRVGSLKWMTGAGSRLAACFFSAK